jgi:hypothetical protein
MVIGARPHVLNFFFVCVFYVLTLVDGLYVPTCVLCCVR